MPEYTFTPGDRVVFAEGDGWNDREVKRGDRATFKRYGETPGQLGGLPLVVLDDGFEFLTWDDNLEPAPENTEGPQWADVEPGDKVVFRVAKTGEEITTTATLEPLAGGREAASILGLSSGLGLPWNRWTLLSIEKPAPVLPTADGSIIKSVSGPEYHLLNGIWRQADSGWYAYSSDASFEDGWTLIRDAGKDEK